MGKTKTVTEKKKNAANVKKLTKGFGERLVELRLKQNISQGDLARRIGVTTEYISLLESGKRSPSMLAMVKIEKVLGASIKTLLAIPDDEVSDEKKRQQLLKLVCLLKNKPVESIIKVILVTEIIFDEKKEYVPLARGARFTDI